MLKRIATGIQYRINLARARRIGVSHDRGSREHRAARLADASLDPVIRDRLAALDRDGFVKLDWFGDIVGDLGAEVASIFDGHRTTDPSVVGQNIKHPFVFSDVPSRIIRDPRLTALVRAYLGDDATFDFSQIMRTPRSANHHTLSGLWHHDRVGNRLKLFVYLHDVQAESRATQYAAGTASMEQPDWSHAGSRATEEFINANYEVAKLAGRKGEAYLFDTNGWHRGVWEANSADRDVLYFEWSRRAKGRKMRALGYHIGICRELFPANVDAAASLLDESMLRPEGGYLVYGEKAPKFNFVHDPVRERPVGSQVRA